jgi:hypothetical protein
VRRVQLVYHKIDKKCNKNHGPGTNGKKEVYYTDIFPKFRNEQVSI